ncbi:uncharacterized protein PFL1_02487 [Pseudozyma flocculosa PF-1]|uniref:Related to KRE6 - beta-1,6-glucan synthetase n=2 Tax=Pseudozyma flocculosa TaxID=84751 RepID=A0A5C3EXX7_9BASI|nr:uncharacterized protein PFL1_02487 [Pseudozyma flocculosa PF-1]EPQ29814.1 hypothetical protein PFL1_02487 [Pseudozyma flocculosa PF-1]SPO37104.1 related to KRE6 - beta-1,6-glucan synthetase [Pseudozyma flocculosa]
MKPSPQGGSAADAAATSSTDPFGDSEASYVLPTISFATNANDAETISIGAPVPFSPSTTRPSSTKSSRHSSSSGSLPIHKRVSNLRSSDAGPNQLAPPATNRDASTTSSAMEPAGTGSTSNLLRRGSNNDSLLSSYFHPDFDAASRQHSYQSHSNHHLQQGSESPAQLVRRNDRINPRAATDEYSLPSSLTGSPGSGNSHRGLYRDEKDADISSAAAYFSNPYTWDTMDGKSEPDDYLHDPEAPEEKEPGAMRSMMGPRGLLNLGVIALLGMGLLMLFAGYPILSYYTRIKESTKGAFNLGGTNATGQIASIPGMRNGLVDPDTPEEVKSILGLDGETKMQLVFSDEFNTDGRSFYPGDDPFWEAVDLHYWATNNYEWYSPEAVTTRDGALEITLDQVETNNLNFRGGMISTWNKFCFTGGYLVASVRLPGAADVPGLWPAVWTMGNLGRAGYGASVEGNWPYTYQQCDVGTLMNQTDADGNPIAAQTGGDVMWNRKKHAKALSFLPGQRLSACTCPDEDHPGPKLADGSWKGRSAPEIDVFEAQVDGRIGMTVSQSLQAAPFNWMYNVTNTTGPAYEFFQPDSHLNSYNGENTQQALSGVSTASQVAVQYGGDDSFAEYGFEYEPGEDGYIEWISDGKPAWKLMHSAFDPDPRAQIGKRVVPTEPLYLIANLGISQNFGTPSWRKLKWPAKMAIDWIRVYQPDGKTNVGCDPPDYPTADYINRHLEAYTNPNLTLWGNTREEGGYGAEWPRNKLYPGGCDAPSRTLPGPPDRVKAPSFPTSAIAVGQN